MQMPRDVANLALAASQRLFLSFRCYLMSWKCIYENHIRPAPAKCQVCVWRPIGCEKKGPKLTNAPINSDWREGNCNCDCDSRRAACIFDVAKLRVCTRCKDVLRVYSTNTCTKLNFVVLLL